MKTLIVYSTKYGCSEKCAKLLMERISGGADLVSLTQNENPDLSLYDKIIIGGPIYMGRLHENLDEFCKNNEEVLKRKKLGVFVCSMFGGKRGEEAMKVSFSDELKKSTVSMQLFGGELNIDKMKFLDKIITKMVAKTTNNPNTEVNKGILIENIDMLANDINKV
ncbi:MAG: flavodoxin domain-containing protein [Clostridia bacterium]|nr:flavodoxin domain-containing protein [Clostridia bacterium]MDD4376408.1 flavodoxin domain-containing protein [Clostridia bacterium]